MHPSDSAPLCDWIEYALQCVQSDKQTLCLRLRALDGDTWLYLCWHPVSGRICTGPQPARGTAAEAFSFGIPLTAISIWLKRFCSTHKLHECNTHGMLPSRSRD